MEHAVSPYPDSWLKIQLLIETRAGLEILNMNVLHRTSIDSACLKRKKNLLGRVERNLIALEHYFKGPKRDESHVFHGRRMYKQYNELVTRLKNQITYIDTWLSQSPPF